MRICIDIDGTICELKQFIGSYDTVRPLPGAVDFMRQRRKEGHEIILYTSRHMKTCGGNVGLAIARQGQRLLTWLRDHGVEYDEIHFGKPHADVYIDDNALRFPGNWSALAQRSWRESAATEAAFRLNIIMPMAGAGRRFREAGFTMPKPLIPVQGEPMYRRSTRSLPLNLAENLVFCIPAEGADVLRADILENFGAYKPQIAVLDAVTGGQAETILKAVDLVNFNRPTLIHNCDSAIAVNQTDFVEAMRTSDGCLVTFSSRDSKFSFVRTDSTGKVVEVREKQAISSHASTGTYYFRSTVQLFNLIENAIRNDEKENGEYYISPLYNKMIDAGQTVIYFPCNGFDCYGTPDQVLNFQYKY